MHAAILRVQRTETTSTMTLGSKEQSQPSLKSSAAAVNLSQADTVSTAEGEDSVVVDTSPDMMTHLHYYTTTTSTETTHISTLKVDILDWETVQQREHHNRQVESAPRDFFRVLSDSDVSDESLPGQDIPSAGGLLAHWEDSAVEKNSPLDPTLTPKLSDEQIRFGSSISLLPSSNASALCDSARGDSNPAPGLDLEVADIDEIKTGGPSALVKPKPRRVIHGTASSSGTGSDPSLLKPGKVSLPDLPPALKTMAVDHPLRILLVEDNIIVQRTTARQLKMLGYSCDIASNGLEAMKMLQIQIIYDVVLLDLHMPEMDGFETAKQIRAKLPANQRPTIIAVTASSSEEESLQCLLLGMAYYLAKPLSVMDLANYLSKCERIKAAPPPAPAAVKQDPAPTLRRKKSF